MNLIAATSNVSQATKLAIEEGLVTANTSRIGVCVQDDPVHAGTKILVPISLPRSHLGLANSNPLDNPEVCDVKQRVTGCYSADSNEGSIGISHQVYSKKKSSPPVQGSVMSVQSNQISAPIKSKKEKKEKIEKKDKKDKIVESLSDEESPSIGAMLTATPIHMEMECKRENTFGIARHDLDKKKEAESVSAAPMAAPMLFAPLPSSAAPPPSFAKKSAAPVSQISSGQRLQSIDRLRSVDGYWTISDQLANIVGVSVETINSQCPSGVKSDAWVTALVLVYLNKQLSKERSLWSMMQTKATEWLQNNLEPSMTVAQLLAAARKLL